MYIVSSCLLGNNCKFDGGNNANSDVIEFYNTHSCCVACPETMALLPVPRPPAERVGDRVIDREGKDITEAFINGVERTWQHVQSQAEKRREDIEGAILKANSPSCGSGKIFDGTFSGTLTGGDGLFTEKLKENGISVISEKEIDKWSTTEKK